MVTPQDPPVFKLERYFAEHEFTVKHLISCSDPESFSMKEILSLADQECKELWDNLSLGYTDSQGHPVLRKEVAGLYPGLSADDVIEIVPQEGIYIAMKVLAGLCKSQDNTKKPHVVATFPAYQSLYDNLKSFGCDVSLWTVQSEDSCWKFRLDDFRSLLREDTKIVVVNFPHNPTGFLPTDEEWLEIINICKERNIYLFSDEMYQLTNNDGSKPYPSACTLYDNAITLFGLSKTFGLPGLRVGWLCTKNETVMKAIAEFKDYITICSSAPAEILAIIALRNKDYLIKKVMDVIQQNLKCADEFFKEFPHVFEWRKPRACTTGFVKLKGWALKMGDGGAEGFCKALREEENVLLLPSNLYDFPDEYVRFGFGRKNLPEVLPILKDFVKKYDLKYKA